MGSAIKPGRSTQMPNKGSTSRMFVRKPHLRPEPASEPSLATLQSTSAPTEGNTANMSARTPTTYFAANRDRGPNLFSPVTSRWISMTTYSIPWNGNNTVIRSLNANLPLNLRMADECLSRLRGTSTIFSPSYNCLYDSPRSLTLATLCTASSSPTAKNTSSNVVVEKATDSATPRKAPNSAGSSSPLSRGNEKAHRTRPRGVVCVPSSSVCISATSSLKEPDRD